MKYRYKKYGLVCCLMLFTMIALSVNVYADSRSVTAYIPVSCVGKNTSEEFTYELKSKPSQYQIVDTSVLKLTDGKKSSFDITYTYPGMYSYEVIQKKGTDENTVYDDSVYEVTVYVTEDDSGLNTFVIAYKNNSDGKVSELTFQNKKSVSDTDNKPSGDRKENQIVPGVETGDVGTMTACICGVVAALLVIVLMLIRKGVIHYDEKKK